jgi:pimeloyl-ACP methyl ester carboxylesterase
VGLLLILIASCGCLSTKRATWRLPDVAVPQSTAVASPSGLIAAASSSYESAYAAAVQRENLSDPTCVDFYFQAAVLAWPEVEGQLIQRGVAQGRPVDIYRSALTRLVYAGQHFSRLDVKRGLQVRSSTGCCTVPVNLHGFTWRPEEVDRLVPVGSYSTDDLNHFYRSPGIGVATVGVHMRRPGELYRRRQQNFSVTALLRPASHDGLPGTFALELFDSLRISGITVGGRQVPLERDLSAPIALVLSEADRDYLAGFLQPGATTGNEGLLMIEPYQRGKIPVVFVHGLLSDPLTWVNLVNEVRAQPALMGRYQIWGFEYATGEPFLTSAAKFRQQLKAARQQLDPTCSDPALSRMVLVGHSMGGLIAKLQVTESGNDIWNAISCRPFESIVTTPETRILLAESVFFEASPNVSRVVFIGTPHQGSPWANRPIGRWGSNLVEEPTSLETDHAQLIRDNPSAFSREYTRGVPTSIDLLKPQSPLLQSINRLPRARHVQLHSIIGSRRWMIGAGDSDEVVPVDSARLGSVVSERMVDAKHTELHKNVDGISELICILRQHLQAFDHTVLPTFVD